MSNQQIIEKAKNFYKDEIIDRDIYDILKQYSRTQEEKVIFEKISGMEENHSNFWKKVIEDRGYMIPDVNTFLVTKIYSFFSKFIPLSYILYFRESGEMLAIDSYYNFFKKGVLSSEENEKLKSIILDELEHENTFKTSFDTIDKNNIRDFVLGMNDGLVELLGAVTGLSAVYITNPQMVGVSGLIVGIAGALSMGIGGFISVRSQRQVNQSQHNQMEMVFDISPERAYKQYKEELVENGIPEQKAQEIAQKIGENKNTLTKILIPKVEENEVKSGLLTGLAYIIGVVFPVLPYFFIGNSIIALIISFLFAGIALFITGLIIAMVSGISMKQKGLEMISAGFIAAILSYLFGHIIKSFLI